MWTLIRLLFGAALVPILLASLWMPQDYHWARQTVSETAGQHVRRAGWTRAGFVAYGVAALLLAGMLLPGRAMFAIGLVPFGMAMVAAGWWCHRHWDAAVPLDPVADRRHSMAAQVAGISFTCTAGAALAFGPGGAWNFAALAAAVLAPLAMVVLPAIGGAAQRLMFLVAALWLMTLG